MTFLEKLDMLMAHKGINKHKLSIMSDVPYTTIDGFYKKGYENAKISTIRKIAKALDVSLDFLIESENEAPHLPSTGQKKPTPVSEDGRERIFLEKMKQLEPEAIEAINTIMDQLIKAREK